MYTSSILENEKAHLFVQSISGVLVRVTWEEKLVFL